MSTNVPDPLDPEDMFSDTRMSIGDHIEDLRTHLLRAIKGFVLGMIVGLWPLGPWVLGIITSPVEQQLLEFDKRKLDREIAENRENLKGARTNLPEIPPPVQLNVPVPE